MSRHSRMTDQPPRMSLRNWRHPALVLLLVLLPAMGRPAWALRPDQIALIANKNIPQSLQLANYYMARRNIPQGRIILLDLPIQEEMSYAQYQQEVVGPVQEFLRERHLQSTIQCLVTFYGVPLRITARRDSPERKAERQEVKQLADQTRNELQAALADARKLAKELGVAQPSTDRTASANPAAQAQNLLNGIWQAISRLPADERIKPLATFAHTLEQLGGSAALVHQFAASQIHDPHASAANRAKWQALADQVASDGKSLEMLGGLPSTRKIRAQQRTEARRLYGLVAYEQLLNDQMRLLDNRQTGAATDSELALLWWNNYPRTRWLVNPLYYGFHGTAPPVMMVMRLDAPNPGIVRNMIAAGLKVEQEGLKGRIVLDSRGIAPMGKDGKPDGYGQYDQTIRNLAQLVRAKVKNLPLTWDDRPAVFPPHSVNSVALYCGWYSVRHYIPSFEFNLGAVGFHVASYELVSLRSPHETGWVHGLLENGVVATLGPVAEPYLQAFPRADDFFPLLLTGKLTLAEVYWKTLPMTSWMMAGVGDPLYTPFKTNPALKVGDLPRRLQSIFRTPATQTTRPAALERAGGSASLTH